MSLTESKSAIINALYEHKGIQHIVNIAAVAINNPIYVSDISNKLIAHSNVLECDSDTWAELVPENHFNVNNAKQVEQAGIYEHLLHNDTPIYGKFDFYPNRFLGCRIRDKHGAIAFAVVVEKTPIKPQDEELLVFLCQSLLLEMLYIDRTAMQKNPVYSLFRDLIENEISQDEVDARTALPNIQFPDTMRLFILQYEKNKIGISIHHLYNQLCANLAICQSIIYEEEILILVNEQMYSPTFLDAMKNILNAWPVYIGASRVFTEITSLKEAFREAHVAITLGCRYHPEEHYFFYDEYLLYAFLESATKHFDTEKYYAPEVKILLEYDHVNGTELALTAKTYLASGRSPQVTAEKMFLHKNTLYYRLQRIEEICHISFENPDTCFGMELTFRLMEL